MEYVFKKYILQLLLILVGLNMVAQQKPLVWDYNVIKISTNTYEIHLRAIIKEGWHTYSQFTPAGGPFPTKITFTKNPFLIINGRPKEEGKIQTEYEESFGVNVKYFSNQVDFMQMVGLKSKIKTTVHSTIEFMVCSDKQCLPPATVSFNITLN